MDIELLISGVKGTFEPVICGAVELCTQKWGAGYLTFSVIKEGSIDFKEGNNVSLRVGGKNMFYGYVFSKKRTKKGVISVVCYDQMRYLKNKDSYAFSNFTASQIFTSITQDYEIKTGIIDNTGYVIPSRIEDNSTLMDIIYNAVAETEKRGYGNYIVWDDYGSLCLRNTKDMVSNLIADDSTIIDFNYKTTIDKGVYNKIKLLYKRETKYTKTVVEFNAKDDDAVKEWGILQYYGHIDINETDGNVKAKELLEQYKTKNRILKVTMLGNVNIRAGWKVYVDFDIGDFIIDDYMRVSECVHRFDGSDHYMTLTLEGGVLDE